MKRTLNYLSIIGLSLLLFAAPLASTKPQILTEIAQKALVEFNAPGLTAAIWENGEVVWSAALGFSNLESLPPKPMTVTDIFRIGSNSKPIAATIMLQLIHEKKVNINDSIYKYIPNYPNYKEKNTITIRHLLNHTSGIRHYNYQEGEKENTQRFTNLKDGLTIYGIDQSPLEFMPGSDFLYSSFGYNLLGAIIEIVENKPYEQIVDERIFKKANMTGSYLDISEKVIPGRVGQYRHGGNDFINAPYIDSSFKWPAGGKLSTVIDLLKFHDAWISDVFFPKKMREVAESTTLLIKQDAVKDIKYGLGWRVLTLNGRSYVCHGGSATGGRSYLLRLKDQNIAVALLVNVEKADRMQEYALMLMEAWLTE